MRSWSLKTLNFRRRTFAAAGVLLSLLVACSQSRQTDLTTAPNFELKDLSGTTVRLESFRGHPVLLDFWATWCGPCRMSIPMVQEFYLRHKDEGLVVLGLNMDEDPSGVYSFVKQFKMTYPVLFAGSSSVTSDYDVQGIPQFVFIDAQGRVVQRYAGFSYQIIDSWEDDLKKAVKSAH